MTTRQLICVDTETNGLDEDLHEPWEIAWHNLNTGEHGQFFVALDVPEFMRNAELEALRINRFLDRYPPRVHAPSALDQARDLWEQLKGNTLVGSNPRFDARMLRRYFTRLGRWLPVNPQPWHHRFWDLSAYAAGVLGLDYLPGLAQVCELLGVATRPDHTAAGDVEALAVCFLDLQARALRAKATATP